MTLSHPEAEARRRAMLRTAMGASIVAALANPAVIEVMVNPDGTLRLDRLGEGRVGIGVRLALTEVERIIRLVASGGAASSLSICEHVRRIGNARPMVETIKAVLGTLLLSQPHARLEISFSAGTATCDRHSVAQHRARNRAAIRIAAIAVGGLRQPHARAA